MKNTKFFLLTLTYFSLFIAQNGYAESLKRSFAWPLEVNQLDPHNTSSDTLFSLIAHYLAPLVDIGPDNNIIPALAKNWTISQDGKTITLQLRKDAYWSDGTRITAQQAKQSIERALSDNMKSDAQLLLTPIKGAQERLDGEKNTPLGIYVPDSTTIVFTLTRSHPDFLRSLAFPIASPVPLHQIEAHSGYPLPEHLSSSGPYRVTNLGKHTADFVVNETYFGEKPHFKQVSFYFEEYKTLIKKFLNTSYDTLEYIPIDQMQWLKKNMHEALEISNNNGAIYLVMKHEDLGGFSAELRKLLIESIDYSRLNDVMTQQYFSTISKLIPWGLPAPISAETSSEKRANAIKKIKQLMEKQGYSKEFPLKTCIKLRKVNSNESLFNFLQAHLRNMHIELHQKAFKNNLLASIKSREPENLCSMVVTGYTSRTRSDEEIIQIFFPGGLFYPFLTNQSELQQKYTQMTQFRDIAKRKVALKDLENFLVEHQYVKALYKIDLISLVNKQRISNYKESKSFTFIPRSQYLKP